jgi:hypothetical protein
MGTSPPSVETTKDDVKDQPKTSDRRDANPPPPPPPAPAVGREEELRRLFTNQGFTLVVHTFLLEHVEAEALARLKKMNAIIDRLERLHQLWFENEQIKEYVNQIDNRMLQKNGEIEELQIQLNGPIPGLPKEQQAARTAINQRIRQLRADLIELGTEFEVARKRIGTPKQVQALDQEFKETRESFREAFDDLRPSCDRVVAEYNKFKQDNQLIEALKELKTIKKAQVSIGPSQAFTAGVARIKKADKILPPETIDGKNKRKYRR